MEKQHIIQNIGFIGTGIMGAPMVRNLMKAGFNLSVYNRTKEKAMPLVHEGATWCNTPADCADGADVVITIVGYPKDVEEIYFGKNGIFEGAKAGTYLIDMTTSSPSLAKRIDKEATKRGLYALDAPVTGGDTGAKNGTLSILVGGDETAFNQLMPVFQAMGKKISYMGAAGCGQHTKLCNQIAIAGALSGACEAISYAKAAGLDPEKMVDAISDGAASSFQLSNVAKKGMEGDFNPGFMLKHFIKDMNLADQEALDRNLTLDITELVRNISTKLADNGHANEGTQALLKYYDENNA